jgi:hypothetical protein
VSSESNYGSCLENDSWTRLHLLLNVRGFEVFLISDIVLVITNL